RSVVLALDSRPTGSETYFMDDSPSVENAVLGLLHDRPLHGYELYRVYSDRSGLRAAWRVKRSRLYAILARLGRAGLVEMEVLGQPSHPPRKVYRLTPAGREALRSWMTDPVSDSRAFRVDFPAKLFFASRLDLPAARRLVAEQAEVCGRWLRDREAASGGTDGFEALVLRFRSGQLRAMEAWLGECVSWLEKGKDFRCG
ncbi:MAG TPA: PadR family transcriptional regulator, partial [Magnetospirillaceae bacterium]|nr:PadR family transcriptional regulator [Magnetospirillaceae bacterium]